VIAFKLGDDLSLTGECLLGSRYPPLCLSEMIEGVWVRHTGE
jgi:hypothetical protein